MTLQRNKSKFPFYFDHTKILPLLISRKPPEYRTLFDACSLPTDPSSFPTIKITNHNADIMLHGMNICALVIETPLIKREVSERVNFILEKTEKLKEISDLPGSLPEDIQRY